ncbi:MAG: hypothetical protein WCP91_03450 [Candidatus Berkelbacteria bacterium]
MGKDLRSWRNGLSLCCGSLGESLPPVRRGNRWAGPDDEADGANDVGPRIVMADTNRNSESKDESR